MCSGTVPDGHMSQKARNPKPGYRVLHSGLAETEQGDSCIEELGNQLQVSSGNIWWSLGPFKNPGRATATLIWGQAGKEWLALPLGLPPHLTPQGGVVSLPTHSQQRRYPWLVSMVRQNRPRCWEVLGRIQSPVPLPSSLGKPAS